MSFRSPLVLTLALFAGCFVVPMHAHAQSDDDATPQKHGRKYKAPPDTSHIEVMVTKGFNNKPIPNAAVIFHPIKDGVDNGTMEVKSDPDGKAIIDVIPMGSQVRVQVLANGFATYAEDFQVTETSRTILVKMVRPQAQVSAYIDNQGKPAQLQPGIQEPAHAKKATPPAATAPPAPAAATPPAPAPSTPPAPQPNPQP
jgi:hypothetical protein